MRITVVGTGYVGLVTGAEADGRLDAWVLGEYRVGEGELPDQSKAADAVLIPMTGRAGAIVTGGAVVVARVRSEHPRGDGVVVLRGHTEPLAPELAATLVDLGGQASAPVRGVLLDTLQVPQRSEAVTAAIEIGRAHV